MLVNYNKEYGIVRKINKYKYKHKIMISQIYKYTGLNNDKGNIARPNNQIKSNNNRTGIKLKKRNSNNKKK